MSNEIAVQEKQTALAINNWDDLLARAEFFAKSALIPVALRGKPADVAVILQMGMELGLSQMQSLSSIDCIQGKPTIPPQLGLALCRGRLPDFHVEWKETTEAKASVTIHRGKESYTSTWDIARAQKLGLMAKQNYQQQLGTMLKWRAVGEGLRAIASDILKGCYLEGEIDGSDTPPGDSQSKVDRLAALNKKADIKDVVSEVVMPNGSTVTLAAEAPADPFQGIEPAPPVAQGPKPEAAKTVAPPRIAPEPAPQWDAELPSVTAPPFDPLASYELKAAHTLKGKTIGSVPHETLTAFLANTKEHFKKLGKPITGLALEDITRIDDFLRNSEPGFGFDQPEAGT